MGIQYKKEELMNASVDVHPGSWRVIRKIESDLDCLLANEEIYWKQRSRIEWLKCGDKNTQFFHCTASVRRARNSIKRLINEHSVWCEGGSEVESIIGQYFSKNISSNRPTNDCIKKTS
ncbi:hypothetical protein ACOSQ2_016753 [Xanthoceras sorbifolium]